MKSTRDTLHSVLSDILEKMAFMFAEDLDEQPEDIEAYQLWHAAIEFKGNVSGRIEITAPESLCLALAANAMGMEPDMIEGVSPKDALGEFLNIVCGEFIEVTQGNQQIYQLSIPVLSECGPECWHKMADTPDAVPLLVEDQPMLARAEILEAPPNQDS